MTSLTQPSHSRTLRLVGGVLVLVWAGVAFAAAWYIWQLEPGEARLIEGGQGNQSEAWWQLFHRNFHVTYPWLLLAPFVIALCLKFPLGIRRTVHALPLLLLATGLFVAASTLLSNKLANNLSPLVLIDSPAQRSPQLHRVEVPTVVFETRDSLQTNSSSTVMLDQIGLAGGTRVFSSGHFKVAISMNTQTVEPEALAREPAGLEKTPMFSASTMGIHLGGFLLLAGLAHTGTYYRRYQDRERQSAQLAAQVDQARLAHLQAQLQPHVLFNSLNGISSFVHDQPDLAVEMITHLSDLLRLSLIQPTDDLIPLRNELEILDHYLNLQRMRFGDRLQIVREIDPASLDVPVPPFVLQPIAENAIRHGIEPLTRPGTLTVKTTRVGNTLQLIVEDDGTGVDNETVSPGTGTGLPNLAERLATLFPQQHRLSIEPGETAGTVVTLTLPAPAV